MGSRTVPLEELNADNTEVRGFNGRAAVNCGFSLPIVLHKPTGLYCALSVTRTPAPVWSTEAQIRELETSGQVTLLSDTEGLSRVSEPLNVTYATKPITLQPVDWNVVPRKQPVVIWAFGRLLMHLAHVSRPDILLTAYNPFSEWYSAVPCQVQQTDDLGSKFFVTCTSTAECEMLLDHWGEIAKHRFDDDLTREQCNWQELRQVADDGLCAARDHGLRYWLYVRYCASHYFSDSGPNAPEPERAYRLFQILVQPIYRGVTWERFVEEMFVIVGWAQDVRRLAKLEGRVGRAVPQPVQEAPELARAKSHPVQQQVIQLDPEELARLSSQEPRRKDQQLHSAEEHSQAVQPQVQHEAQAQSPPKIIKG
jgi:hypothetical protein